MENLSKVRDTLEIKAKLFTGEPVEMAELQWVLENATDYFQRSTGTGPTESEAISLLEAIPPGLSEEDKYVFGFYIGNRLIGCADVVRAWPEEDIAYVGLILLVDECRGRGFGRKIFQLIESEVRSWSEVRKMRLAVLKTNDITEPFFKKMGFRPTGEVRPYMYENLITENVFFEKYLDH